MEFPKREVSVEQKKESAAYSTCRTGQEPEEIPGSGGTMGFRLVADIGGAAVSAD